MNIQCPYCGHGMGLKDVKPGKYKPKCNRCEQRFLLTVPADAPANPVVDKLDGTQAPFAPAEGTVAPSRKTTGVDATAASSGPTAASTPPAKPQKTFAEAAAAAPRPASRRETTRSDEGDVTVAPVAARPNDATAAGAGFSAPEMRTPGTELAMDATTIDPRPKTSSIPEMLGGYKLVRELGRGAMGAVYLAKQLSLDRNVALKLIQAKWASNPVFVARFTREAYAAAQLTHHNVVQIYDLGVQSDINYYTMEYVSGQSLAQLVQKQGKLDAEAAVGYILQAARGLNFAHLQGMVHRDVKPANLMLNEQGVVKVADLGLVKTPQLLEESDAGADATVDFSPGSHSGHGSSLSAATAEVTMANIAMGTPAYMAPEQAANAAGVDHRADIYSLGCTLYVLLTGRPPFEGASALEVITKHRTEPIMRPEAIVKRIPAELSNIVLKMVGKRPEDRYQNMGEVIRTLENFLGVQSSGPFSPREEHAQTLDNCLAKFNNAPLARIRNLVIPGFYVSCVALCSVLFFLNWSYMSAVLAMACGAAAAHFIIGGLATHDYFFDKVRSYVFSQRIGDWITNLGSVGVAVLMIWLLGWTVPVIGGIMLGVLVGAGFHFGINKPLAASRAEAVEAMEALLKSLRLKGVEEVAIEQFVAKYSGEQWEEFFEQIFGYESMLRARTELVRLEQGRRRQKFATWRDGIIKSIDAKLTADRERRDKRHLQKVEEENLRAQGLDAGKAREQAQAMADAQVEAAAEVRALPTEKTQTALAVDDPRLIAAQKRDRQLQMMAEARGGKRKGERRAWPLVEMLGPPLVFLLGARVRFLLGAILLASFLYWLSINGVLGELDKTASAALDNTEAVADTEKIQQVADSIFHKLYKVMLAPDQLDSLPIPVVDKLLSHFGTGIAGVSLLVLGWFPSWRISLFALPAAICSVGVIVIMPQMMLVGYGIGAGLAVAGVLLGRNWE